MEAKLAPTSTPPPETSQPSTMASMNFRGLSMGNGSENKFVAHDRQRLFDFQDVKMTEDCSNFFGNLDALKALR